MKISGAVLLRTTATGFARADDEQYLASKGSEVTILENHVKAGKDKKSSKQTQLAKRSRQNG
ncbi:hypothetical protein [Enterococcus wangshanyuanii]|uniref:Uncharacterized protein n=1 Tax=Enterococcus wangshanyuanii TaxID=2005703 RepID=A0ABQ1PVK8_9ENTE|nr:hypothetical protein [Enterococcus wangshanyuanii]GGD04946.1 hypothetical protein GCM10011573_38060 [Enterococcus wangshanyuanii]